LSNPAGATLADGTGEGTITDDDVNACGAPTFSAGTERALFLWKDCVTDEWTVRATAGGSPTTVKYVGEVDADQNLSLVSVFSLEGNDVVDNTTDPTRISYTLSMKNSGQDGYTFSFPSGTNACFDVTTLPVGTLVLVGAGKFPMVPPFNLDTLGSCIGLSVDDVTVDESAGMATFTVALSSPSPLAVTVDYLTVDDTATAGVDYTAVGNTLIFPANDTTPQTIDVPILEDVEQEGDEQYFVVLSNASNALIADDSGVGTIMDNEIDPCGAPSYSPGAVQGLFLWKNCTTGEWTVRATAGGSPTTVTYVGEVSADQNLSLVSLFSLERNDVVDNTTDPMRISYTLKMKNSGQDGYTFSFPSGTNACFTVDPGSPGGGTVLVGAGKTPLNNPFDLETLVSCP